MVEELSEISFYTLTWEELVELENFTKKDLQLLFRAHFYFLY